MTIPPAARRPLEALGATFDEPLARKTWWRVGGPADAFVRPHTLDALVALQRLAAEHDLPLHALGNGSNLLVHDDGVRGLVVQLAGDLADTVEDGDHLACGAGLKLAVLLARAGRRGWGGLAPFAGIPGTIGGAVRMNAGSTLGETGDLLDRVEVVLPGGEVAVLSKADLGLGYRHCSLPEGAIVARAWLARRPREDVGEQERVRTFLARRKATQPLDKPTCGSTFTNPPGDAAGRLIEAAGLKGHRVGGAVVSEKHANFVVTEDGATAADVAALIGLVRETVAEVHGVRLTAEVQRLGWT